MMAAAKLPCFAAQESNVQLQARQQMAQGRAKAAISILVQDIRKNPSELSTRRLLVEALIQVGQSVRAAEEMRGLLKVGMRSSEDFCLLADAYRYAGKQTSALQNYQESLNIAPELAHAKAGMALCYMLSGLPKVGEKVCKEAIAMTHDSISRRELIQTLKTIKESELVNAPINNRDTAQI